MRQEELKNMPILSLGEIIAKLEGISEVEKDREEEPTVRYNFEYLRPTTLDSWRGVYAELALGFTDEGDWPKLSDFIKMLKSAIGKTFTGYKGGDFVMGRGTPVWVANYGNSGNTGIVNIKNLGYEVVLITQDLDRG